MRLEDGQTIGRYRRVAKSILTGDRADDPAAL
jgi:hypothetical protein